MRRLLLPALLAALATAPASLALGSTDAGTGRGVFLFADQQGTNCSSSDALATMVLDRSDGSARLDVVACKLVGASWPAGSCTVEAGVTSCHVEDRVEGLDWWFDSLGATLEANGDLFFVRHANFSNPPNPMVWAFSGDLLLV